MSQNKKYSLLALGSLALATNAARAQPAADFPKDSKVSNVIEVKPMEPTNARINALKLPAGFHIAKFAEMSNPRMIAVASDGTVYISQRESGTLVMLKDLNGDGRADVQKVIATRKFLHGIALRGNYLYFITIRELYRARRKPDGTIGTPQLLIKDLPDAGQHPNRTLNFGPDGKLYISVGSTTQRGARTERGKRHDFGLRRQRQESQNFRVGLAQHNRFRLESGFRANVRLGSGH